MVRSSMKDRTTLPRVYPQLGTCLRKMDVGGCLVGCDAVRTCRHLQFWRQYFPRKRRCPPTSSRDLSRRTTAIDTGCYLNETVHLLWEAFTTLRTHDMRCIPVFHSPRPEDSYRSPRFYLVLYYRPDIANSMPAATKVPTETFSCTQDNVYENSWRWGTSFKAFALRFLHLE
jgi:hypothetical protein